MSPRCRAGVGALLSTLIVSCASGAAPPAAPAPHDQASSRRAVGATDRAGDDSTTSVAASSSARPSPVTTSGEQGPPDECRVDAELELAYARIAENEPREQWLAKARAKLLPRELAERLLTGISQEILSALAHRKYDKLVAFAGKDGICMRAARGAPCRQLSPSALAGCAASRVRLTWPASAGDAAPAEYDCGDAFRRIFYARDFLHVGKPRFNCFGASHDGAAPIIASGPRLGYVELRSDGAGEPRSLWFVFDGDAHAPELVEMIGDAAGT